MKSLLRYGAIPLTIVLVLWLIIPRHKITINPIMGQSDHYAEQLHHHLAGMLRNMETKEFIQDNNIPKLDVSIYNFNTSMRIEVRVNEDPFPATTYLLNKKLPAHIAAAMVKITVIDPLILRIHTRRPRQGCAGFLLTINVGFIYNVRRLKLGVPALCISKVCHL